MAELESITVKGKTYEVNGEGDNVLKSITVKGQTFVVENESAEDGTEEEY